MSEDTVEVSKKELSLHSRRPTQEYYGATPKSFRELGDEQNKKPSEIIKPVLKLSGLLSMDDDIEDIGPGAIFEGMTIIVAREITNNKGRDGTEFKRGRVVDMKDDPDHEKTFRLMQPNEVPENKRHAVLLRKEDEEIFKLDELRGDFQQSKIIFFKIN